MYFNIWTYGNSLPQNRRRQTQGTLLSEYCSLAHWLQSNPPILLLLNKTSCSKMQHCLQLNGVYTMSKRGRIKQMFSRNKTQVSPAPVITEPRQRAQRCTTETRNYTSFHVISINSLKPHGETDIWKLTGGSIKGTIRYSILHLRVLEGLSVKNFHCNCPLTVSTPICAKRKLGRS